MSAFSPPLPHPAGPGCLKIVDTHRRARPTLDEFRASFKSDPTLVSRKESARRELHRLYRLAQQHFGLVDRDVWLPKRLVSKKHGQCSPGDLRVYPWSQSGSVHGISFLTQEQIFSVLIHEVGHALVWDEPARSEADDHGPAFCAAEREVADFFRNAGFGALMTYPLSQGPNVSWSRQPSQALAGGAPSAGRCFVATAAFGSADCSVVRDLRTFRERVLRPHATGRVVIRLYEWA